jgi:hypothetical protein
VEPKDVGNPGGFTETAGVTLAIAVIEAAEQMAEYGGDNCAAAPASDQAQRLARHRNAPANVGHGLEHGGNIGVIHEALEVCRRRRKSDDGAGPGDEAKGFKAAERGTQIFPSCPTDKAVKFIECVRWDLAGGSLTPLGYHFMAGKPGAQVHELDLSDAIRRPDQTELLDGEKHKSPVWLVGRELRICGCGHVASHDRRGQRSGVRIPREGSTDFGTNVPCEAHNLVLTAGQS